MERTELARLVRQTPDAGSCVTVCGWVRTVRDSKNIGFIELNDGSCFKNVQVVFEAAKLDNYREIAHCGVGAALSVTGVVVLTPDARQPFEINATAIEVLGSCPPEYPLQKKRHSMEFLRTMPHLRARTNTFSAVFRVRSVAAYAIHRFFQENGFVYTHTPILTGSDCEGAGEMFQVTTLNVADPPRTPDGAVDYSQDFFGQQVNLTVSGQLEGEAFACAFGKIYTFGPTFRAENSNPPRHAAEFWMIEPEIAFADLTDEMDLSEAMVKYVVGYVMQTCPDDLAFFNNFVDKGLLERLRALCDADFARMSYTEAVALLEQHNDQFQYKMSWGADLQTEHERFLAEQVHKRPVFVYDYPKEIKSFYMRQNEDGRPVAAADLLVPGVGELVGGSQREERLDKLRARMAELGMGEADYSQYLDLRRYGSVPHAGFGLGFERLIMYLTGMANIRDVLLYPRTAGGL